MSKSVNEYYEHPESRYGYKLVLRNAQHFGYYPNINDNITELQAQNKLHDLLIDKLELEDGMRVLDAGCGRGVVSTYIALKKKVNIVGIDLVKYITQKAKERAEKLHLSNMVSYINGDYSNTPFENDSYDRIYTVETLSHSPNLPKTLMEFYRVLKDNEIAVFIEYEIAPFVQFNSYEKEMYDLVRDGSSMSSLDDFVEGNFVKMLERTGFSLLEEIDMTLNRSKSMKRLYNLAIIPYQIIRLAGLRKLFVNTTAGIEFYKLNQKNLFRYKLYKVRKVPKY